MVPFLSAQPYKERGCTFGIHQLDSKRLVSHSHPPNQPFYFISRCCVKKREVDGCTRYWFNLYQHMHTYRRDMTMPISSTTRANQHTSSAAGTDVAGLRAWSADQRVDSEKPWRDASRACCMVAPVTSKAVQPSHSCSAAAPSAAEPAAVAAAAAGWWTAAPGCLGAELSSTDGASPVNGTAVDTHSRTHLVDAVPMGGPSC